MVTFALTVPLQEAVLWARWPVSLKPQRLLVNQSDLIKEEETGFTPTISASLGLELSLHTCLHGVRDPRGLPRPSAVPVQAKVRGLSSG